MRLVCLRIVLCWDAAGAADQSITKKDTKDILLGIRAKFSTVTTMASNTLLPFCVLCLHEVWFFSLDDQ